MVKHTQTIRWQFADKFLSVFDHFLGLALKGFTYFTPTFHFYVTNLQSVVFWRFQMITSLAWNTSISTWIWTKLCYLEYLCNFFETIYVSKATSTYQYSNFYGFNPSCSDSWRREKINLNFYFHFSLGYLKRFYEALKDHRKTF